MKKTWFQSAAHFKSKNMAVLHVLQPWGINAVCNQSSRHVFILICIIIIFFTAICLIPFLSKYKYGKVLTALNLIYKRKISCLCTFSPWKLLKTCTLWNTHTHLKLIKGFIQYNLHIGQLNEVGGMFFKAVWKPSKRERDFFAMKCNLQYWFVSNGGRFSISLSWPKWCIIPLFSVTLH